MKALLRASVVVIVFTSFFLDEPKSYSQEDQVKSLLAENGSLCGVLAARSILKSLEIASNIEIEGFVANPRYVTERGSTTDQLCKMVSEYGGDALAFECGSISLLKDLQTPALLHISRSGIGGPFDHWIAFYGFEGAAKVRILEPPMKMQSIAVDDLLQLWDGIGIVVSNKSTARYFGVSSLFERYLIPVCFATLVFFLFAKCVNRKTLVTKLAIMVIGTLGLSLIRLSESDGPLFCRSLSASVAASKSLVPVNIDAANLSDVEQVVKDSTKGILIDSREPSSFKRSHIPTALNLPVNSSSVEL